MITPNEVKKRIGANLPDSFVQKWFLSLPVLRREDEEELNLCLFCTAIHRIDREKKVMDRPSLWLTADPWTCTLTGMYACDIKEFSDAEYGTEYSMKYLSRHDHLEELLMQRDFLFDSWYTYLLNHNTVNEDIYMQYMDILVKTTPDNYRRFFLELSKI